MTGCLALRKDVYYVRLTYYDNKHQRKDKWVSTGLSGTGAKRKAEAMIDSLIEKYSYLETCTHPTKVHDFLMTWKDLQKDKIAASTYDGFHTYIDNTSFPISKTST